MRWQFRLRKNEENIMVVKTHENPEDMPVGKTLCNESEIAMYQGFHFNGPELIKADYWNRDGLQKSGFVCLTANAGAIQMLLPETISGIGTKEQFIKEISTGKFCAITHGFHSVYGRNMYEVLFDDGTQYPFQICVSEPMFVNGFTDAMIGKDMVIKIYIDGDKRKLPRHRDGAPTTVLEMPCGVRRKNLPYMKPWRGNKESYDIVPVKNGR
jgi:hypothetical protein